MIRGIPGASDRDTQYRSSATFDLSITHTQKEDELWPYVVERIVRWEAVVNEQKIEHRQQADPIRVLAKAPGARCQACSRQSPWLSLHDERKKSRKPPFLARLVSCCALAAPLAGGYISTFMLLKPRLLGGYIFLPILLFLWCSRPWQQSQPIHVHAPSRGLPAEHIGHARCVPQAVVVSPQENSLTILQDLALCSPSPFSSELRLHNKSWTEIFMLLHSAGFATVVIVTFRRTSAHHLLELYRHASKHLDSVILVAAERQDDVADIFVFDRRLVAGAPGFTRGSAGDTSLRLWLSALSSLRGLEIVDCTKQVVTTKRPSDSRPNLSPGSDINLLLQLLDVSREGSQEFLSRPCAFLPMCVANSTWFVKWDQRLERYLILARSEEQSLMWSRARMEEIKNIHREKRCVVMGNGPSLNRMDLRFLSKEIVFASNKIFLGFKKFGFLPHVYSAVNRHVLNQSTAQILDIPGVKVLPFRKFMPHAGVIFCDANAPSNRFQVNGRTLTQGSTVTYVLLQLAYWTGCSQVVLIGVDHYFKQVGSPHELQVLNGSDPNHFSADYFRDQPWQLAALSESERHYRIARETFNLDGRSIIDATLGGHCTVFPKVPYEELFLQG